MLRAAGLDEMVCSTQDAYVARAVELGHNREQMSAIRAKLAAGRDTCLLFNTPKLVEGLEELYRQMWSDFKSGTLPVPDLRNLDIYHDIGVTLDLENIETLSDEAYYALYQEKLAEWDQLSPFIPIIGFGGRTERLGPLRTRGGRSLKSLYLPQGGGIALNSGFGTLALARCIMHDIARGGPLGSPHPLPEECSSMARAPVSKTGGCRFESCHSCQAATVRAIAAGSD